MVGQLSPGVSGLTLTVTPWRGRQCRALHQVHDTTGACHLRSAAGPAGPPVLQHRERRSVAGCHTHRQLEAVGRPETYQQAFYARDLAGTVVLVGVPMPEMKLELPLLDVFGRGGALKSSWYGDCLPSRDFPMLIDLHLQGRLPLDRFATETIQLTDVERAFERMHHGDVLRSVVVL
jgi:Zn-dependent alcohol dehydrogenase